MKQYRDVTFQFTNPTEYELMQEDSSESIEWAELREQRKEHARKILHNEPDKSIFDIAIIALLPVRIVRELAKEVRRSGER